MCSGNFQVNGKLIVNGGGVVTALNDDYGNPHSLSMGWSGSDLMVLVDNTWFHLSTSDHNLWDHAIDWTSAGNVRLNRESNDSIYNLACVQWVKDTFEKKSSDERVKTNFQSLPEQIDGIFDTFSVRAYEYKKGIPGEGGIHFGETSQHIEEIFKDNHLDIDDYNIVQKRRVDSESKEDLYITDDEFHYINQNNVLWLCVDQIQKLKKRVKELETVIACEPLSNREV